jgi:PEP-CTERM motif
MPAWLSPRVRLGVTVSLIVLIACAIVLTPYLFHDDADAPGSLTSESASIDLLPSSPPPPVLPRSVRPAIDGLVPLSLPPSREASLPNGSDTYASEAATDSSPDDAAKPVPDWFEPSALAAQGIPWSSIDCVDCGPTPSQVAMLKQQPIYLSPGGGSGGGGGGGLAAPSMVSPATVTDVEPPTAQGDGPGDGPSTPPGPPGNGPNPPTNPPTTPVAPTDPHGPEGPGDPGDPIEPDPHEPPVVQVPEPASLVMAGAGALSFMIRGHLSRKRPR